MPLVKVTLKTGEPHYVKTEYVVGLCPDGDNTTIEVETKKPLCVVGKLDDIATLLNGDGPMRASVGQVGHGNDGHAKKAFTAKDHGK